MKNHKTQTKTVKIGQHKAGGRIMLEAQWLAEAGFPCGQKYIIKNIVPINDGIASFGPARIKLIAEGTNGSKALAAMGGTSRAVSGGWTSSRRKACPVIDIKGVNRTFGEEATHAALEISQGKIVITEGKAHQP